MIDSKKQLHDYLDMDATQFGGKKPGLVDFILKNEKWFIYHLKRQLRFVEYYQNCSTNFIMKLAYLYHFYLYKRLCWKCKCIINPNTCGPGLTIWHLGSFIYVRKGSCVGKNFTIVAGVVLGQQKHDGKEKIVVGDNCYCGLNVCLLGNVVIGDNVTIGANAVVTKNIPDNAVVVGANKIIRIDNDK